MKKFLSEEVRKHLGISDLECMILSCVLGDLSQEESSTATGLSIHMVRKVSKKLRTRFGLAHTGGATVVILKKALGIYNNNELIEFINLAFKSQMEEKK